MRAIRLTPLLGLVVLLVFMPGALAHHCTGGDENDSSFPAEFSTQTTAVSLSPLAVLAVVGIAVLVPLAILGAALAGTKKGATAQAPSGSWVWTPTQWVFLPNKK